MSGIKKIERDNYLFREGDAPDALYVVKSGKFAVVKNKSNSEIVLAELNPGQMVGEMAFFDNKPRSASVKALKDSEVIALPYKGLHAQFANFPEWCKAIMRTVNENLRNANQRLKQLEKAEGEQELFPPHTLTKLVSILNLVGHRYGKMSEEDKGLAVSGGIIRNYTIQIFQEPTHKMQKLMGCLMDLGMLRIDDVGDGRQKIVIYQPDFLFQFVEWYNDWLFKSEKDRTVIKEDEIRILEAVGHFSKNLEPNNKGLVKLSLTDMQNDSMRELNSLIKVEDTLPLVEKKLIGEHTMTDDGKGVYCFLNKEELNKILPFWKIIYAVKKLHR